MDGPPLLDRVSSQSLRRLAAERGLAPEVTPVAEDTLRARGRRWWMRWLPGFFLVLSLGSLVGMAFGVGALAEDGWSTADVVQLVLMALLVFSVVTQFRGVLRRTPLAKFSPLRRPALTPNPSPDSYLAGEGRDRGFDLDLVSAEDLAFIRRAQLPRARRTAIARRRGGRAFEQVSVVAVVALGALAFAAMLAVCGYMAFEHGLSEPGLWLTLPFAGLTGFGSWQVFGSARKAAFRGRPLTLMSRAFRDSVRVWGSGSVVSRLAMTTTATASVAGAAAAPAILGPGTPFDLFILDTASAGIYRIDLATRTSSQLGGDESAARAVAFGSTQVRLTAANGQKLPASSLVAVFEAPGGQQRSVAFRPGSNQTTPLARIEPPIPGAVFAWGGGAMYAVQPDGAFWTIADDGIATRAGQLTVPPGPMAWDAGAKVLLMLSGNDLVRIDPVTRSPLGTVAVAPEGFEACGIARGPGDRLYMAEKGTGELFLIRFGNRGARPFETVGETPEAGCLMTVAKRP